MSARAGLRSFRAALPFAGLYIHYTEDADSKPVLRPSIRIPRPDESPLLGFGKYEKPWANVYIRLVSPTNGST